MNRATVSDPFRDKLSPFKVAMRKEVTILLQFVLITALVGYGYFALMLVLNGTIALGLWHEYEQLLIKWIFSFVVLSFIRFAVYYFAFRHGAYYSTHSSDKDLIRKEISATIQYLILAAVSVPVSFYIILSSHFAPDISINIMEFWRSVSGAYRDWLIGFSMVSLLRLAIIYLKKQTLARLIH